MPRQLIRWVCGVVCLVASAGCAAFPASTPTPTPELSARDIAARSAQRMDAAKSLHFLIQLTGALAYIDSPPLTALKQVEGDLVRPADVKAMVKLSSFGIVTQLGLIRYGTEVFVTNPLNQRWEELPPEWGWYINPGLIFDPKSGVTAVLPTLDLTKVGLEPIEGRPQYHLQTTAEGDYLKAWTMGMIYQGAVKVDVWIDVDTFVMSRATLVQLASDPTDPTVWHIDLSAVDQPVKIERPPTVEAAQPGPTSSAPPDATGDGHS